MTDLEGDRWAIVFVLACLSLVGACGGGSSSSDRSSTAGAGSTDGQCKSIAANRGASETCCPNYGADACGAGLVCAALDGRTIPSCYPERSRLGGQQCTTNQLCISGVCAPTQKCAGVSGDTCDIATGCADPTSSTARVGCCGALSADTGVDASTLRCVDIPGDGSGCSYCITAADCSYDKALLCVTGRCVYPSGHTRSDPNCCVKGGTCTSSVCVCK